MNRRDRATLALLTVLAALTGVNLALGIAYGNWWTIAGATGATILGSISAVYLARKHKEQR